MPNNEKNAEPAVRDAQSTAARRRRRRHTPHGDAPAQNPAPRAPQPKDASRPCPPRQAAPNNRSNAAKPAALKPAQRPARPNNANQARPVAPQLNGQPPRGQQKPQPTPQPPRRRPPKQKFANFEEYMAAHGGATAPIAGEGPLPELVPEFHLLSVPAENLVPAEDDE